MHRGYHFDIVESRVGYIVYHGQCFYRAGHHTPCFTRHRSRRIASFRRGCPKISFAAGTRVLAPLLRHARLRGFEKGQACPPSGPQYLGPSAKDVLPPRDYSGMNV